MLKQKEFTMLNRKAVLETTKITAFLTVLGFAFSAAIALVPLNYILLGLVVVAMCMSIKMIYDDQVLKQEKLAELNKK
jgi:hypothetical protein